MDPSIFMQCYMYEFQFQRRNLATIMLVNSDITSDIDNSKSTMVMSIYQMVLLSVGSLNYGSLLFSNTKSKYKVISNIRKEII